MDQTWNPTRLDFFPGPKGKKIPIPGGLILYIINVTIYKNELSGKLNIEPTDPGAIHLYADVGRDYAKQMCAEYQDEHGWWICPNGKPNHHWDIGVYGLALADILQLRIRRKQSEAGPARRVLSRGVTNDG
jgi:phage terminase large subunit GpA-like protein